MIKSKLWIVDDEESIREICKSALEDSFFIETFPNGSEALLALNSDKPDLIITDIKMPGLSGLDLLQKVSEKYPGLPTIVITAHSDIDNALSAYKGGAFEYLPKPFDVDKIRSLALKALNQSDSAITPKKSKTMQPPKIIGQAQSLQNLFRAIGKISNSDITVLIRGESGTGKELIAQAVHDNSKRNVEPFVAINVAAIPHDLLESELFGHEKGAFTGAQAQRIGRFEQAQGGTLFLDEIGDMHPELQTRLLRVLSSQEFYRVGGHRPIKSDVRIIAATNQSIEDLIKIGKFREDLYHRLNVFKLVLPPLRERKEDIASLITYFLKTYAAELNTEEKRIDDATLQYLIEFNWPGNIRQLRNFVAQLSVIEKERMITADKLEEQLPNISTSGLVKFEDKNKADLSEREILYKVLFDMKRDLTELKKITFV
jgi:two-component system nitrogen regulation response regulator GlnG